MQYITG